MPEVKLPAPVEAKLSFADDLTIPGSFSISNVQDDGKAIFWYCCPCGCGSEGALSVGIGFKPDGGPTWNWDGDLDRPTLSPSIHHTGHWHGWLRQGVYTDV